MSGAIPTELHRYERRRARHALLSAWSPSVFVGSRDRGLYGGASLFFDFENRRAAGFTPFTSSLYTVGTEQFAQGLR